jgi:hypothetical protein
MPISRIGRNGRYYSGLGTKADDVRRKDARLNAEKSRRLAVYEVMSRFLTGEALSKRVLKIGSMRWVKAHPSIR